MVKHVKGNKKRQQGGLVWVHQNGNGDLVIKDKEKVKGLNASFTLIFTGKISLLKQISNYRHQNQVLLDLQYICIYLREHLC